MLLVACDMTQVVLTTMTPFTYAFKFHVVPETHSYVWTRWYDRPRAIVPVTLKVAAELPFHTARIRSVPLVSSSRSHPPVAPPAFAAPKSKVRAKLFVSEEFRLRSISTLKLTPAVASPNACVAGQLTPSLKPCVGEIPTPATPRFFRIVCVAVVHAPGSPETISTGWISAPAFASIHAVIRRPSGCDRSITGLCGWKVRGFGRIRRAIYPTVFFCSM